MVFKEHFYQPFNEPDGKSSKISRRAFLATSIGALSFMAGKKTFEALANQPEEEQELEQMVNELKQGLAGKTLELNHLLADEEASKEDKQLAQITLKMFEPFSLNLMVVDLMNQKLLAAQKSGNKDLEKEIAVQIAPYIDKVNEFITEKADADSDKEPEEEAETEKKNIFI